MNVGMSAAELHRHEQAIHNSRGAAGVASRYRTTSSAAGAKNNDCISETGSTATTTVTDHSSQQDSPAQQQQQQQPTDPSLESAKMRTRTNFGDTQTYLPPATKSYPYSVPTGAPATPTRVNLVTPNRLTSPNRPARGLTLPCTPDRHQDDDSLMDRSPRNTTSSIMSFSPSRNPLDAKRLQFFDDSVSCDQVPFDQVWNQQEFVLGEEVSADGDANLSMDGSRQQFQQQQQQQHQHHEQQQQQYHEQQHQVVYDAASVNYDTPFDEAPDKVTDISGASGFSAFSNKSGPPPPPPPMTPKQKARLIVNTRVIGQQHNSVAASSSSHLNMRSRDAPVSRHGDPPEVRAHVPLIASPVTSPETVGSAAHVIPHDVSDGDIPSDEDDTKRRQSQPKPYDNRNRRSLSLATASRGLTAEEVGRSRVAQKLKSANIHSNNHSHSQSKRDNDYHDDIDEEEEEEGTMEGDDDSLFDFKGQLSSSPKTSWREEVAGNVSSDDDMSVEGDDTQDADAPCLKTRAQKAFASRRRFSPRKNSPGPSSPRSQSRDPLPDIMPDIPAKPKAQVSFGAINTVHHFEHHEEYSDQEESILSDENQKTIGSDVEDAIRDIFMINAIRSCNPNPSPRRRIRYHADTREERREAENSDNSDVEDDDDDTIQSYDGEPSTSSRRKSANSTTSEEPKESQELQTDDVFYETMMSMVEGGIGVMTAALGFASSADAAEEEPTSTSNNLKSSSPPRSSPKSSARSSTKSSPPRPTPPTNERRKVFDRQESENENGVLESVISESVISDYVLGPGKSESSEYLEPELERGFEPEFEPEFEPAFEPEFESVFEQEETLDDEVPEGEVEYDDEFQIVAHADEEEDEPQTLEEDPSILELAKQAALCMHEVRGAKYDESREVDIADIQFSVIELSLPLGIIFQEDYSGCWVTRVMPKGNAHLSGKIEPGDQLAAINGQSSIGMKVDDICEAITAPATGEETIGLTFLRYVGPYLPLPDDFEVDMATKEGVYDDDNSVCSESPSLVLEENPRSTISIMNVDSKMSYKDAEQPPASPKRGRKKFKKWFKLSKKSSTKSE